MTEKILLKPETVITAHVNADFDALAAIVAAGKLYPGAVLLFPGSQEKNLRHFFIESATYLFNFKTLKDIDVDAVKRLVVVDTRQVSRLSHIQPLLDRDDLEIHVYDHHPDTDEDLPAAKSVVKPWGSSVAVIVHEYMDKDIEIGSEEATMLGLGVFEDTGSFSFNSTTEHDFMAGAWLKARGMDLDVISDILTRELSAEQIGILNDLLASAQTHEIHGIEVVVAQVSTNRYVNDFAFLVHKLLDMENMRVLFALARMDDRVHMVARSKSPDVDVGRICRDFGGGGHSYAASASIRDKTLVQVSDELFARLFAHVQPKLVVEKLMSRPPVSIAENRTMKDGVELMTRYSLKGVPVVSEDGSTCVGILAHDTADKAVAHGLDEVRVSEYMSRDFESITPDSGFYEVMDIIIGRRQRLVPVVSDKGLVGVITRTDLVNVLVEDPARIPETLLPERSRERAIKTLMNNRLPAGITALLRSAGDLASRLGQEIYAVGGFVRDILLARANLDIDLVVEGDGMAFARALAEELGGRATVHTKFKTAVVILGPGPWGKSQRVDVATARLEYYEYPAALPTVELSSIKMDLYRRDFTVNALAVNLLPGSYGRLVDFFGAQRDIKDRTLRVLHSLSFVEDPTRIVRAIRFEQRYQFRIGGQTERLIKNAVQLKIFEKLSGSRVFHELQLLMAEEQPLSCLRRMREFKLLKAIHPDLILDPPKEKIIEQLEKVHSWYKMLYLESKLTPWKLYMLGLTRGIPHERMKLITGRLHFSKREEREFLELRTRVFETTQKLVDWHSRSGPVSSMYFILKPLAVEGVLYLMARSKKEETKRNISLFLTKLKDIDIDITGNDLIAMGIPPGPVFTPILHKVLAAKIDGETPNRAEQLEYAALLGRKLLAGERRRPVRPRRAARKAGHGESKKGTDI